MNFYQRQHAFYCGVDLHARTLYLCILSQQGDKDTMKQGRQVRSSSPPN